ncbi:MAG: ATP-dependent helicase [Anaerolineaceae bacterium]|nr:ATP-dependent helicase [Anaerolineaceae bacterium]
MTINYPSPSPTTSLTKQQQAVVNHNNGPALVFAVAGAGKTTAMVYRIERLVREGHARPKQILATSFGKANIDDLTAALARWPHCAQVDCRTLHSLGYLLIKKAQQLGHLSHLKLNSPDQDNASQRLLTHALTVARQQAVAYVRELDGLDRQDFLDYVGACKGNLAYADLTAVMLTKPFANVAQQAEAPSAKLSWYLDLYRLFETVRQQAGVVTYDDMLLTGWEALVRFPELRTAVQSHYRYVLVDEFQDINRAQAQILDLLTTPERNYMAIGDDDQCIYEWRGASPAYILKFPKQYSATVYKIENNFRCPAAPLALANRVIAHNRQRAPKQMGLTKGFVGETAVFFSQDLAEMSQQIVTQIQQLLASHEVTANEIAILVRLNAQTPPIEQALITAGIPYRVGTPFYERREIKTLIDYGRLAWYETQFKTGSPVLTQTGVAGLVDSWYSICNQPKRYISRDVQRHITAGIRQQTEPVSSLLTDLSQRVSEEWLKDNLYELAQLLRWLATQLAQKAYTVLQELVDRLDYLEFLRESSGFAETGEGRAASVEAFINFAQRSGSLQTFMTEIRDLGQQRADQTNKNLAAITLSTIHRAKGLEWPHVFIPQINQETLPYLGGNTPNLEEERRLFYVGLTRTKCNLYLHALRSQPLSVFLKQGRHRETLTEISEVTAVLAKPPDTWQASEIVSLITLTGKHQLLPYFENWWPLSAVERAAAVFRIHWFWQSYQASGDSRLDGMLDKASVRPWLALQPVEEPPPDDLFPGLDTYLTKQAKSGARQEKVSRNKSQTVRKLPELEPEIVRPGMWFLCDAGWGKIVEILDIVRRPLGEVERSNIFIRLEVIFHPDLDRLRAEVDISARQIIFHSDKTLYACGKCDAFISTDSNRILKDHNREAHEDISPSLHRLNGNRLRLSHYRFALTAP